ncbi:6056_t:CDS:2, partial [Acaulospora colombiana]
SSSQKFFFWMQDAKDDKDEENVNKVNRLLNDPHGALAESRQQNSSSTSQLGGQWAMDQDQLMQLFQSQGPFGLVRLENIGLYYILDKIYILISVDYSLPIPSTTPASEPQPIAATTSEAGSGARSEHTVTPEQLGNLRDILSGIQMSALFPHLPPNINRTPEELREVIQSPQFAQALQSLSIALQSGQLGPLLTQLGLDPSAGNGVEAFLRAIQEQASRRQEHHEEDNADEQSGDRMEED